MKKGIISKLGAGAVVLTLVTASLVGGTFAKYAKNIEGKATATVAAFSFNEGNAGFQTVGVKLIESGLLVPGVKGTVDIELVSKSDVAVDYTIDIGTLPTLPGGTIEFYEDKDGVADTAAKKTFEGDLAAMQGDVAVEKTVTLHWTWVAPDDISVASGDPIEIPITVTGTQTQTP